MLDAGVFQNPIQQTRANFFLRMDGYRHNSLRLGIPELSVTALACSEFCESMLLEQPNQLRPCHALIFEPNVGLSQPLLSECGRLLELELRFEPTFDSERCRSGNGFQMDFPVPGNPVEPAAEPLPGVETPVGECPRERHACPSVLVAAVGVVAGRMLYGVTNLRDLVQSCVIGISRIVGLREECRRRADALLNGNALESRCEGSLNLLGEVLNGPDRIADHGSADDVSLLNQNLIGYQANRVFARLDQ